MPKVPGWRRRKRKEKAGVGKNGVTGPSQRPLRRRGRGRATRRRRKKRRRKSWEEEGTDRRIMSEKKRKGKKGKRE